MEWCGGKGKGVGCTEIKLSGLVGSVIEWGGRKLVEED